MPVAALEPTIAAEALPGAQSRRRLTGNGAAADLGRRVLLYLVALWGAMSASFVFFRLIPGDPIGAITAQLESQGAYSSQGQSADLAAHYRTAFGLDGSLFHQYIQYTRHVLFHFDFGPSVLSFPNPATALVWRALPWTLGLIGTATVLGWLAGVFGGVFVGWPARAGSRIGSRISRS